MNSEVSSHPYIQTAFQHVQQDLEHLTGKSVQDLPLPRLVIGIPGQHPQLDRWSAEGRIDLSALSGEWEAFRICELPGEQALVIAGSDPRGTAYGLYHLSEHLGVSPWYWFADVSVPRVDSLSFEGLDLFWKPAVRYRGLFINDDVWGLQAWASRSFAPEEPLIGPRVYRRVMELLMRLKANLLWPSMWGQGTRSEHPAFYSQPENLELAQRYGIVMGSSHGEALNASPAEWQQWCEQKGESPDWNMSENFATMTRFWQERLDVSTRTENLYTIGLRGLNDEPMDGASSQTEKIRIVEHAIHTQRDLLESATGRPARDIPQIFCPYKEVLPLFEAGLQIPGDVTLLFTDDDFGYLRSLPALQARPGGVGMYYHGDYYGGPKSYVWLGGVSLDLMYHEMERAGRLGIQQVWVLNAGNIKLHELATEYFLHLAVHSGTDAALAPDLFRYHWAAREFGRAAAPGIAYILGELDRLHTRCKPDHAMPGLFDRTEGEALLARLNALADQVSELAAGIVEERQDAFEQMVRFPVLATRHTHAMMISETEHLRHRRWGHRIARHWGIQAQHAFSALDRICSAYQSELAGGKWQHLMEGPRGGHNWEEPWKPCMEPHIPDIRPLPPAPGPAVHLWIAGQPGPEVPGTPPFSPRSLCAWTDSPLQISEVSSLRSWQACAKDVQLIPDSHCSDFQLQLEAWSSDRIGILFGYEDPENSYWVEAGPSGMHAQMGRLLGGARLPVTWNEQLCWPARIWKDLELVKQGDQIKLLSGGVLLMVAEGPQVLALRGQIGFACRQGELRIRKVRLNILNSIRAEPLQLPALLPEEEDSCSLEMFNRSEAPLAWQARSPVDWIRITPASGSLDEVQRVKIHADWTRVPTEIPTGLSIHLVCGPEQFQLPLRLQPPVAGSFRAKAQQPQGLTPEALQPYLREPGTLQSGLGPHGQVLPLPETPLGGAPALSLPLTWEDSGLWQITLLILPTRPAWNTEAMRLALAVGDSTPQMLDLELRKDPWGISTRSTLHRQAVLRGFHSGRIHHSLDAAGKQPLHLWALDPGIELAGLDLIRLHGV